MVISDRQMGHPQLAAKSGALSCRLMHSCSAMDRHMQHAVFHTIAFLVFSCLAFSTPATWCHIFMSRNFVSSIFSVPGRWRAPSQKIYEFFVSRKRLCYGQRAVKRVCVCCMLTLYTMSLPTQSRCSCRQCRRTKPSPTRGAHVDLATTQARPPSRGGRQTSPARRRVRRCASLTRPRPPPPAGVMSAKPPRRR